MKKKTIIRIRKFYHTDTWWQIQKHGSSKYICAWTLYEAIRKVSVLIDDRDNVTKINFEILYKTRSRRIEIGIRSKFLYWTIRKYGSFSYPDAIAVDSLSRAIRKVSTLIEDRGNVVGINAVVIRE